MAIMQQQAFGTTGLRTSVLGFGAGQIGSPDLPEDKVRGLRGHLLNAAAAVREGPLPSAEVDRWRAAFALHGGSWLPQL